LILRRRQSDAPLRAVACHAAVAAAFGTLAACSNLASSQDPAPDSSAFPAYRTTIANYVKTAFKNQGALQATEISDLTWTHTSAGWSWLACIRFQEEGHRHIYSVFLRDNAIVDSRYAVKTDQCEAKAYSPFDLATGLVTAPAPDSATGMPMALPTGTMPAPAPASGPGPLY
jgi:hypothetical protein